MLSLIVLFIPVECTCMCDVVTCVLLCKNAVIKKCRVHEDMFPSSSTDMFVRR